MGRAPRLPTFVHTVIASLLRVMAWLVLSGVVVLVGAALGAWLVCRRDK